ncbi:MAG TPA: flagellar basal body rod C-terminal domain-containing protein [Acidimicrobiia bacterium]|nr:flagellar basal body rod C-terminal domain-containing protein [Acidimicrobiia bacterium]
MALYDVLQTSGSGMSVYRTWLEAISDNVSNMSTAKPTDEEAFQERFVIAEAANYGRAGGVRVAGIELGNPEGRVVWEPNHPLADEEGLVRYPDINLGDQMTNMILAQRGYQANLAVIERARDAYTAALRIGS